MMDEVLQGRVRNGAAVLDLTKPNWREDINLTTLDLNNEHRCVLGQTYGSYTTGAKVLGFQPYGDTENTAVDWGFMPEEDDDDDSSSLTAAWVEFLTEGVEA